MEHLLANPALSIFHLLTLDLVMSRLKRVMIAMFGAGCRDVNLPCSGFNKQQDTHCGLDHNIDSPCVTVFDFERLLEFSFTTKQYSCFTSNNLSSSKKS